MCTYALSMVLLGLFEQVIRDHMYTCMCGILGHFEQVIRVCMFTCVCGVFEHEIVYNMLCYAQYRCLLSTFGFGGKSHVVSNHSLTCSFCCHILLFFRLSTCC